MDLSILIVGYNSRALLEPCLASLTRELSTQLRFEVAVVDNASTDGTIEWIRREHPSIQVVANSENVGFARACNQALSVTSGRLVLFLNPDTEVPAGALDDLARELEASPSTGLIGPRLTGEGPPAWGEFPSFWNLLLGQIATGPSVEPGRGPVDWLLGACVMARRGLMERLEGFDEDYFLYGEDMDLCDRVAEAGLQVVYYPAVTVVHRGNPVFSTDRLDRISRARLLFFRKRRSLIEFGLVYLGTLIVRGLRRLKACISPNS